MRKKGIRSVSFCERECRSLCRRRKTVPRLFAHTSPVNSTSETADVSELTRVESAIEREKIRCERVCVRGPAHFRTLFSRPERRDLARAPLTRARTRATVCRTESCLRRLARTRVGSRSGLSGRTRRRYTFTSQHSANHHRDGFHVFQEANILSKQTIELVR